MGKTLRKAPLVPKENPEQYCIDALYHSLQKFHISESFYSVGEYAEEAICLEKSGSGWIVYGGERGNKYDIKTHVNCRGACLDVISRITETVDEEKSVSDYFNLECDKKRFILPLAGTEALKKRARTALH